MASSVLFSVVVWVTMVYSGFCLDAAKDINRSEEFSGLTDRELILSLVKRINDLETWNKNQQTDIHSLQATVRQQKRKIDVLERDLVQHPKQSSELLNNQIIPPEDILPGEFEESTEFSNNERASPRSRIQQGRVFMRKFKDKRIARQVEGVPEVAFYATAGKNFMNLGEHQVLEFQNVTTNIGNAYNHHTGIFTAPHDGTYVFSMSLTGLDKLLSNYYMSKNGYSIGWIYNSGLAAQGTTSTHTAILQLRRQDSVEIRNSEGGNNLWGGSYSCFSGFLLYPADDASVVIG